MQPQDNYDYVISGSNVLVTSRILYYEKFMVIKITRYDGNNPDHRFDCKWL